MNINRSEILGLILEQIESDLLVLEQALEVTRDTATHSDCLGSSKYETMGLEASYLAQGQGTRLLEVERSLEYFKRLKPSECSDVIGLSSLVEIKDEQGDTQLLWLAADAGGLEVEYDQKTVTLITPKAPLGRMLMGKTTGDDFEISIAGKKRCYEIVVIN